MKSIEIDRPQKTDTKAGVMVSANVDDFPVWFESKDTSLNASIEAFASAFLIPAAATRRTLRVVEPVCQVWYRNSEILLDLACEWWEYASDRASVSLRQDSSASTGGKPSTETSVSSGPGATALCFSGGADSFYSLIHGGHSPSCLVFVHGFDVDLQDETRARACEESLRKVASKFDVKPIVIRTNVREHPLFKSTNWEHTHGGPLASIGHLLSPDYNKLIIPPSFPISHGAWGSHGKLMPMFSSASTQLVCGDVSTVRRQRVEKIASNELVRAHLRVCFENLTATGNCSSCRKCLVTMLYLLELGELKHYPVFDQTVPFSKRIDELTFLPTARQTETFEGFIQRGKLGQDESEALARLVRRSREVLNLRKECEVLRKSNRDWEIANRELTERVFFLEGNLNRASSDLFNRLGRNLVSTTKTFIRRRQSKFPG